MPRSLWILLAILLVDQLDAGMMMPIYPQLFTDPESGELLVDPQRAKGFGMLFVALLGAAYALPALVAQPLIGQLADRHGRRPLLIASFVSSTLGFALFAVGIQWEALWLLVVARVVDGVAAGNLLVAQAAVADLSDEGDRTRYFGYFTAALSLGFVVGPLLGGWIGDPDTGTWAGPATAFYVAGALNLVSVIVFALAFRETLDEGNRDREHGFEVMRGLRNARAAFGDERRRPYYLILFAYLAGYTFLMGFLSVVLEERLELEPRGMGHFFAALGMGLMVVQLLVVERVERWFGPRRSLWLALFVAAGATLAMGLAPSLWVAYAAIVPFALAAGTIDPMIMSLLSKSASEERQGRVQGVRGSVDSLARTIPPFLAGPIAAAGAAAWAVYVGAGVMAAGGLMALRLLGGDSAASAERDSAASADRDTAAGAERDSAAGAERESADAERPEVDGSGAGSGDGPGDESSDESSDGSRDEPSDESKAGPSDGSPARAVVPDARSEQVRNRIVKPDHVR